MNGFLWLLYDQIVEWLLVENKNNFGIFSCIHALMVLIYYVNSITVPLNNCGHYRYHHIIKTRFSMHIVYQLSFWCLAEDLIWRMKTWFLNKLNQDQIFWYVMYMNICIFLKLSFVIYRKIFTIPIFYPAYTIGYRNQG